MPATGKEFVQGKGNISILPATTQSMGLGGCRLLGIDAAIGLLQDQNQASASASSVFSDSAFSCSSS